jgi:hypothetical protein
MESSRILKTMIRCTMGVPHGVHYLLMFLHLFRLDVNECLASPCKSHEVCVNKIKTGYECQCPKKFMRDKATKKCICSNSENLCPKHERCVPVILKSKMSYRCVGKLILFSTLQVAMCADAPCFIILFCLTPDYYIIINI